ncbi:Kelch repeat-containing protein [Polyangium spumosum]|nr:kelch repeat-containing protein [Polyangium spumosum]
MAHWRMHATATKLPDGRVLVAGGRDLDTIDLESAEVFDPGSGTWAVVESMGLARKKHTATRLQDGNVLVVGGSRNYFGETSSVERYDWQTGTWTSESSMPAPRSDHVAVSLMDGRVLVAGGRGVPLYVRETILFDPATGSWLDAGDLTYARDGHTATRLSDGRVAVIGGHDGALGASIAAIEIFDPASGVWSLGPDLVSGRYLHASIGQHGDDVLVIGGQRDSYGRVASVESCNLGSGAPGCTELPSLNHARREHTAVELSTGFVMVTGGFGQLGDSVSSSVELFDPSSKTWSLTGSLVDPRESHLATLLDDGSVLVVGGNASSKTTGGAERWLAASNGMPCISGGECLSGHCVDDVCCKAACKGICNGCSEAKTGLPDGTCSPVAKHPCNAYLCLPSGECANSCETDSDCMPDHVCSGAATCIPAPPICKDDHAIRDGVAIPCGNYRCGDAGQCLDKCTTNEDCVVEAACTDMNTCVRTAKDGMPPGCACRTTTPAGNEAGACVILMAIVVRVHRRRPGAPRPRERSMREEA